MGVGVGAGLYMYDVVVKKFTFAVSSPDEFLYCLVDKATTRLAREIITKLMRKF